MFCSIAGSEAFRRIRHEDKIVCSTSVVNSTDGRFSWDAIFQQASEVRQGFSRTRPNGLSPFGAAFQKIGEKLRPQ